LGGGWVFKTRPQAAGNYGIFDIGPSH